MSTTSRSVAALVSTVLAVCCSHGFAQTDSAMYDLTIDPGEAFNLVDNVAYAAVQSELEARLAFYQDTALGAASMPEATFNGAIFRNAGGVTPFLDFDSPPEKMTLPAATRSESAPSIVFILLDDGKQLLCLSSLTCRFQNIPCLPPLHAFFSGVGRRGVQHPGRRLA